MKLSEWYKSPSGRVWMMAAVIVMLIVMILTRWGYVSHKAGAAFRERFASPSAQADTTAITPDTVKSGNGAISGF